MAMVMPIIKLIYILLLLDLRIIRNKYCIISSNHVAVLYGRVDKEYNNIVAKYQTQYNVSQKIFHFHLVQVNHLKDFRNEIS